MKNKIEVARSFSYKLSMPNYENRDFFCAAKTEVSEEEMEETSQKLYTFCKKEVERSVEEYKKQLAKEEENLKNRKAKMADDLSKSNEIGYEEF